MDLFQAAWKHKTPYITEEATRKLKEYKYVYTDDSMFYKYFWSPLAEYITTFTPDWVAYTYIIIT